MHHFVELRHNTLALPSRTTPDAFVGASELIFIATENDYTLNHKYESQQHLQAHTYRCVADDAGKRRLILALVQLLPEGDPLLLSVQAYVATQAAAAPEPK